MFISFVKSLDVCKQQRIGYCCKQLRIGYGFAETGVPHIKQLRFRPAPIISNLQSKKKKKNKSSSSSSFPFPTNQKISPPILFSHQKMKSSSTSEPTIEDNNNNNQPQQQQQQQQHVIVMRHGDRIDNVEPLWMTTAERPWDPPLVDAGKVRAFCTGRKFRGNLGFPINRVLVSPFIRCIETAAEVISALCAVNDNDPLEMTGANIAVDPSKLKVSIEYGLCEILNREAIRCELVPKDGRWGFKISELEAKFPDGTVDRTIERLYPEMPRWEEPTSDARIRYAHVIRALADKFPSENLLLVTHGEGVGVAVSAFLKDTLVHEVEYCAYAHLKRQISFSSNQSFTATNLEVVTNNGETGIRFCPTSPLVDS